MIELMLTLICIVQPLNQVHSITGYQPISGTVHIEGNSATYILLRKFVLQGNEYFLIGNTRDMSTRIVSAKDQEFVISSPDESRRKLASTPYIAAINKGLKRRFFLQNAGVIEVEKSIPAIHVTADLCPSGLPLDYDLFNMLIEYHRLNGKGPAPVSLAVSGKWMEKHQKDLAWLCSMERAGLLEITWMNHSYSHRYNKTQDLRGNYFLTPGTNVEDEILHTEKIMIMNGITPSLFIRFPGLVSNSSVYDRITRLGLIPVGSNAWIAKRERPAAGSIVLVHANGNEPEGIELLKRFFDRQMKLPREKRFVLYNLRKSMAGIIESDKYNDNK